MFSEKLKEGYTEERTCRGRGARRLARRERGQRLPRQQQPVLPQPRDQETLSEQRLHHVSAVEGVFAVGAADPTLPGHNTSDSALGDIFTVGQSVFQTKRLGNYTTVYALSQTLRHAVKPADLTEKNS
eukprot:COSAG05_NODE_323_length_11408_cov_361.826156_16_plen_128_part_00